VSIRPYLELTDTEKYRARWAAGRIVIQSGGNGARHPARNKQWYPERFEAVVKDLYREWEFVQLGSTEDLSLQYATDLRGVTTMREAAAILYNARLYVGAVGFLMHLARAVECPSVIVFGGREAPWQSGYMCNANLYSPVPCAPCWRWNSCELDRKCMTDISVADVVSAIRAMIGKPRGPLGVEWVHIAPDRVLALPFEYDHSPSPRRHGKHKTAAKSPTL
jgi:ADP-heptose:LPS heptosyltransferase